MIPVDLRGRRCLVTGATSELGRVIVRRLMQAGADVAVHYHTNADQAKQLCCEAADYGVRAAAVRADVTQRDQVVAMHNQIIGELGPIDTVIQNAVIQYIWQNVLEQNEEDFASQFHSNVLQCVLLAQAFIPAMIDRKFGRYIAMNTECAMQCWPSQSAYIAGKRGLDGVVRVLAREVGEHAVTVNQVAPGWTLSENRPDSKEPFVQQYKDNIPLKRRGVDLEVANAVVFLASDLAGFITGAYLPVCGGNVMPCI